MTTTTIEMVSYKLKAGVSLEQLKSTHHGVNDFCMAQPGFLYRSISQDDDHTWYDIVYWQDMDCAKTAGDAFMQSSAGQALVSLIDSDTMLMRHMLADSEAYLPTAAAV
jgi:hypothetical protein